MDLDNAQWYKPRSPLLLTARRITISGVAQHQEAKQEYSRETEYVFILPAEDNFPDSNEGVVTNNQ